SLKRAPTIGRTKPSSTSRLTASPISRFTSRLPITNAPQPAPTTSRLLRRSRFTRTSGIEPPVKPTTTARPFSARERRLSVKRSPTTGPLCPAQGAEPVLEAIAAHGVDHAVHPAAGQLLRLVLPCAVRAHHLVGA